MHMGRHWRVVLATLCVEAVAVATVPVYGALSLVAVAVVYWIDLAFVIARTVVRQLVGGETTVVDLPKAVPPFRLLRYKRGTLDVSASLPPIYLRSLPTVLFSLSILAASALSTGVVLVVSIPERFWTDPMTPLVLAGAVVAAATKSWLIYTDHADRNGVENARETGFLARKRQLAVLVYAPLLYIVADFTTSVPAKPEGVNTVVFAASVLILLRIGYGIRASRPSSDQGDMLGRVASLLSDERPAATPSLPSTPDGQPHETTEPVARSVAAAGFLNALTTGGVVDGRFSDPGLSLRVMGFLFAFVPGTLAAANGSRTFQVVVVGVVVSAIVFWLLSTVHMELAFGETEYRFYDSTVVAYDRRLEEPQWSVPYDNIKTVSVERGPFDSPLWLDSGTVAMALTDDTAPMPDEKGRASILFVTDPEIISERIDTNRRDARRHVRFQ
jgi:hypothetical protein